jgi:glycosyltransferase involved in cell wall biosynthesis
MQNSSSAPIHPRISLITVCWNAEATIGETLKSIDKQIFRDFEHIIIDGASNDATLSIVKSATAENRQLFSEPDKGIYDAMNKGLDVARGDIVGFLNADDVFADDHVLERIFDAFEAPEVDGTYGDLVYVERDQPNRITRYWRSSEFRLRSFRKGWFPPHPTLYLKRDVYNRVGHFNLDYRHAADVEFMMRVFEVRRVRAVRIPEVLVRMKGGGASNNGLQTVLRQNREILTALSKHGLAVPPAFYWWHKLLSRLVQLVEGKMRRCSGG